MDNRFGEIAGIRGEHAGACAPNEIQSQSSSSGNQKLKAFRCISS